MTHHIYAVTVLGYGTEHISAASRGKAIASAWRSDAFSHLSFRDFLKIVSARRSEVPEEDGYGYIRRAYNVSPTIGQRVRLKNEGPNWNGREGTVIYPGRSTAYVHVVMDGEDRHVVVHPMSVELL